MALWCPKESAMACFLDDRFNTCPRLDQEKAADRVG